MKRAVITLGCLGLSIVALMSAEMIVGADRAHAQAVVSDGTLNTIVTPAGNTFTIDNGTTSGTNLFHSFREFSLPTGSTAIFNNATNIQNIFSRVTGGTVSNLDGAIRANGTANLFLLNPAGILFGSSASLNIGGSFVGTTAQAIQFADGTEFSAVNPTTPPLLTMSVPIGLQMGTASRGISINNTGHTVTQLGFAPLNLSTTPPGLAVLPGRSISLVASEIMLNGGIISADSGAINITALESGQFTFTPNAQGYHALSDSQSRFGTISLQNGSLLNVSGGRAGEVVLQGQDITLNQGSAVIGQNFGPIAGGDVQIFADRALNLSGETSITSQIITQALGTGAGGNIEIISPTISIAGGATITASTYGSAPAGNITVQSNQLLNLVGASVLNPAWRSVIANSTFGAGNASKLSISAHRILIEASATISSTTLGSGSGGQIEVNATDAIELTGASPIAKSDISSITFGNGDAGQISITAPRLTLKDGAGILATTFAAGNGGNLWLNVGETLEILGIAGLPPSVVQTTISSSATSVAGSPLQALFGLPDIPTGNSGDIVIRTPNLKLTHGAQLGVASDGSGQAGDLRVNAGTLSLRNQAQITALTRSQDGGNINLAIADLLLLRENSAINVESLGKGTGGNINIQAPVIVGLENSNIIANALNDRGGNINITTKKIIGLEFRNTLTPRLDPTNDITASGGIGFDNGTVQINNVGVDPNSGLVELPANLNDPTQQIAQGCQDTQGSSFIVSGRGGMPQNPTQDVRSDRTWNDVRDLSGFHKGAIAQSPTSTPTIVQATAWYRNPQTGKVELLATQPTHPTSSATCASASYPTGSNL